MIIFEKKFTAMKIFYNSKIAKFFTFLPGFKTISLFGMVFTEKESLGERTICHETVHASQYSDLFIAGLMTAAFAYGIWLGLTDEHCLAMLWLLLLPIFLFYVWYLTEYFIRLIINLVKGVGGPSHTAYRAIAFEQEARDLECCCTEEEDGTEPFSFFQYYYK